MSDAQAHKVRHLNDQLRRTGAGGMVLMTRGIQALGPQKVASIVEAVRSFEDFDSDNDPYGEHDFALLSVGGVGVMFKIDYYDLDMEFLSPDPADPALTRRVLTILLADEY